jgi:hypothetical protein
MIELCYNSIMQNTTEEAMEDQTILEQTQDIRSRYQRGEISPEEAKRLIKPYYDQYIRLAKEKAKSAGMRAPIMSLQKFLSRRSDLRYAAQQRVIEERGRQRGDES